LDLKNYYDTAAACNRCGFCTSSCPTYIATGEEGMSPRGRNQTFRALIEGKITDPLAAQRIVDSCLLCNECTTVCFSEVPTAHLMVLAREEINKKKGLDKGFKFFLEKILPYPNRMKWVMKAGFLAKKLGLSSILRKLGLLQKVAPVLAAGDSLLKDAPLIFLFDREESKRHLEESLRAEDQLKLEAEHKIEQMRKNNDTVPENLLRQAGALRRPKIAYVPVCGSQYLRPSIGVATLQLCEKLKLDFVVPKFSCCGLPAASSGALDQVRELAKANILRVERGNYESLLIDDNSCSSHFKDYPKYFQGDREWLSRSQAVAGKVRDIASFLLHRGLTDQLKKITWNGGPVAYHDPCKAQHAQKIIDSPRELLSAIKKLTLVPVTEADQCCGGGGTYSLLHPELSGDVLARKIKHIEASGCRLLVTASASCWLQLSSGLLKAGSTIEVLHLSEFLIRAIEKQR
jgi:glycolate oxidase iron-sulfur subunit